MADPFLTALVYDFLSYKLNGRCVLIVPGKEALHGRDDVVRNLKSAVHLFEANYGTELSAMLDEFDEADLTGSVERIFSGVTEELFLDGVMTWPRIVSLFVFSGAWVVRVSRSDKVEAIARGLLSHVSSLSEWIEGNGGWESLRFYTEENDDEGGLSTDVLSWLLCSGIFLYVPYLVATMIIHAIDWVRAEE